MSARALLIAALLAMASVATAEEPPAPANDSAGYTPDTDAQPVLVTSGYIDVGFAHAGGDGTSFAPDDDRLPADYGVDTFAPAVNARGDVASTDSGGRFVNHFLPHSVGIGGQPSFLLNTADFDLRYTPSQVPVMVFGRLQALPRFGKDGDATRVLVEQAFGRLAPFPLELALTVGKFDPVFGIEYLDNEANLRTGITPSLVARYTTGQQLGAKVFYRAQLPALWSALSINLAATNGSSEIDALQTNDLSLAGAPVGSVRLGYELDLPRVQLKLGASGLYGPRNDQPDASVTQRAWGVDARFYVAGLSLSGELVDLDQDEGTTDVKLTGTGPGVFASGFHVRGGYVQAGYAYRTGLASLERITVYGRYGRRHAAFQGFTPITVDRLTAGVRVDLWDTLALKGELLFNRELEGAPSVPNDVQTLSLVFSW